MKNVKKACSATINSAGPKRENGDEIRYRMTQSCERTRIIENENHFILWCLLASTCRRFLIPNCSRSRYTTCYA